MPSWDFLAGGKKISVRNFKIIPFLLDTISDQVKCAIVWKTGHCFHKWKQHWILHSYIFSTPYTLTRGSDTNY